MTNFVGCVIFVVSCGYAITAVITAVTYAMAIIVVAERKWFWQFCFGKKKFLLTAIKL